MVKYLWQPPQLRTGQGEENEERRATWLELFFDLVFVAAISQLSAYLSDRPSLDGFMSFVALFVPVWWCWVGATFYATRFDTDDLGHRLMTLVQIVLITVMAVNIHDGLDRSSVGFALAYTAFRLVLVAQYLYAGYHLPQARSLTDWYAASFSVGAACWLISTVVSPPWRFGLWGIGLLIDFAAPLLGGQRVARFPPNISHIPERLGLFIIIVLGESILAGVKGLAGRELQPLAVVAALIGLGIAFCLWWLYFDSVDGSPLRYMQQGQMGIGLTWLYTHLPLAIGLTSIGVAIEHLAKKDGITWLTSDRWLVCGGVALSLLAMAVIHSISCELGDLHRRKKLSTVRVGAAVIALGLAVAGAPLVPVVVLGLVAILCTLQVVVGLVNAPQIRPTPPNDLTSGSGGASF
jgi:low temperature requirement protein LtrA